MIDFSKRVTKQQLDKKADNNASLLAEIRAKYPNVDLTTATHESLAEWLEAARANERQGKYEHFLPFHDVVVPVSIDTGDFDIRWSYGGNDYALSSDGVVIATYSGWRPINAE